MSRRGQWAVWDHTTKQVLSLHRVRELAEVQAMVERSAVACGKGDPASTGDITVRLWSTGSGIRYPGRSAEEAPTQG